MARGDEERDQVEELDRSAGPSVDEQDRELRLVVAAAARCSLPDEVDALPAPVREPIESALDLPPVVVAGPVLAELAQIAVVGAVLPAQILRLGRPARPAQTFAQLVEVLLGNRDVVWLDPAPGLHHTGSSSPRRRRRRICIATVVERSRISTRSPGMTMSRASIVPAESRTHQQT